jgi:undecaprenyl-diphosphatase
MRFDRAEVWTLAAVFAIAGLVLAFGHVTPAARVFTTSFPSGHATVSTITYLTLGALLASLHDSLRFKIYFLSLAILLAVAVGVSRVYLGVHYPTDVLAGWCIGAAWAAFCWTIFRWLQRRGGIGLPSR